jgi:K(+)-stimulated pyrophosphate-energized sodium pump
MWIMLIMAAITLVAAAFFYGRVTKGTIEDDRMREIAGFIRDGAMAYLGRQYRVLIIFVVVMFVVLAAIPQLGLTMAICFAFGALLSTLAGFVGMRAATSANARTTQAAKKGLKAALSVALSGGAVMGLCVTGLGAAGVCIVYLITKDINILTGFSLGASSTALFCRVGGGIYTKAADVGADLVGKVEAGIPEDDPRNPAVIADNVGDNVGDVAGMGADLFESYVGSIISALMIGVAMFGEKGLSFTTIIVAVGLGASILGIVLAHCMPAKKAQAPLNTGTYVSILLALIAALAASKIVFGDFQAFFAVGVGMIAGGIIGKVTELYTSGDYKSVKSVVKSSETGTATNILSGFTLGMKSTLAPILIIAVAIYISYALMGVAGIALAAVGMLCTVGMVITVDAYGPIADNAGGIAEMAQVPVREITDHLDSVGNTTAAVGKGFSIGSAALTALALLSTYAQGAGLADINMLESNVIIGLMIGAVLTFLFSALCIESVDKAAREMIMEVRRQFREIPGLLEGTGKPDYKKCVDISTRAALKQMILPSVIAICAPIIVGLLLGKGALGGLLLGATITGVLLAIMMSNAGGAWDNAKKSIEEAGQKGTELHKSAVVGDTVGDPFKDTAGPAINILIKLMCMVALVFMPLFM